MNYIDEKNLNRNWSNIESDIECFITGPYAKEEQMVFNKKECKRFYECYLNAKDYGSINNNYLSIGIAKEVLTIPTDITQFDDLFF